MLITLVVLVVAINQGLFPVSSVQLMSRCAGGIIAGQLAKLANGNIPYHRCHAQSTNGAWLGGRKISAFLSFHEFLNPLLAGSLNLFFGLRIGDWMVWKKVVLCLDCFPYSLLSFLSSLVVAVIFPLLSY